MSDTSWCLVMVAWGQKYHDGYVDVLVSAAFEKSTSLTGAVLFTDVIRAGIDPRVKQVEIPAELRRPEFFRGGYPVKLCLFDQRHLPADMPCVYIDLDTLILGDLQQLAKLVQEPEQVFMLPPSVIGFNPLSRLMFRLSGGARYRVGNSSILAFHSGSAANLALQFVAEYDSTPGDKPKHLQIDDVFISKTRQPYLKDVPAHLGAMFRREFLSRLPRPLYRRRAGAATLARRRSLIAVTLNDAPFKPEKIAGWRDGQVIMDPKGRRGIWSDRTIGPVRAEIQRLCRQIVARDPGRG